MLVFLTPTKSVKPITGPTGSELTMSLQTPLSSIMILVSVIAQCAPVTVGGTKMYFLSTVSPFLMDKDVVVMSIKVGLVHKS